MTSHTEKHAIPNTFDHSSIVVVNTCTSRFSGNVFLQMKVMLGGGGREEDVQTLRILTEFPRVSIT